MKRTFFLMVALFLIALPAYAEFNVSLWKFKKQIKVPTGTGGYVAVKADNELLLSSNGLADVRIIDSDGKEIGYQLIEKQAEQNTDHYPSTILNQVTRGGELMFIADLGYSGLIHNRISLITSATNFKRQVSVFTSDGLLAHDSYGWRLLTNQEYIYDVSDLKNGVKVTKMEVAYPETSSRYLRVVIGKGDLQDIDVNGVRIFQQMNTLIPDDTVLTPLSITENPSSKTTSLVADLGGTGIPTHSITLSSASQNFGRRVMVQASADQSSWTMLSQDYIFSEGSDVFHGNRLTIEYPETVARYIRVLSFNDDATEPIIYNPAATLQSVVRSFVFPVTLKKTYDLYYGNRQTAETHYDISRFFKTIESQTIPQAKLGPEVVNAEYKEPRSGVGAIGSHRYILRMIMFLALAVAVFLIFYTEYVVIRKRRA